MGLNYPVQNAVTLISSSTLTATYSNTKEVGVTGADKLTLLITYTPKTGQTNRFITFKLAGGATTGDAFQEISDSNSITTGLATMSQKSYKFIGATGGTAYYIRKVYDIAEKFVTVSVKEDGSSNFGAIVVQAIISGK